MTFFKSRTFINAIKISFLVALIYFPLFLHLEKLPMKIWDESRLAVNAIEMSQNHNYIVTYFDGQPDMWNTKPPLMIWVQTVMIKIMGIRELAMRLPSALAALFTALLLLVFSMKYAKSYWYGFISVVILITANGYVHHHGTRTGDYDSLLTLLTTSYCLSFFLYLETNKIKFLHLFFLPLTLALLTKGVQASIFLPALAIYTITQKGKLKAILSNKWLYINAALLLLAVGGYYLAREHYNPGYLNAVYENELGGRYLKPMEGHDEEFLYYFNNFKNERFRSWYYFAICGFFLGLSLRNTKLRKITIFSSINIVFYWLIISNAKTKLEWYDLPMYPFLALVTAITIFSVFSFLKTSQTLQKKYYLKYIPFLFLFIIIFSPYRDIIKKVYMPSETEKDYYSMSYLLRERLKNPNPVHHYNISFDNPDKAHLLFYIYMTRSKGRSIEIKDCRYLNPGDEIIAIQKHEKEFIEKFYKYELLETKDQTNGYKIISRIN